MAFAKLDSGIVDSTLWMQPHDVLRVWIAMLAKCDSYGLIRASVPAMAHLCMVPIERLDQILHLLTSPDPYSRTADEDGRRIRVIEGGWLIVNYVKYRDLLQTKAQSHAERQRRYRQRLDERDSKVTRDKLVMPSVTRDAEAEAEAEVKESTLRVEVNAERVDVPFRQIVDLYHSKLPSLQRCEKLTKNRKGYIRQRWTEDLPSLQAWANYFDDVSKSDFLMGKVPGRQGQAPFRAHLEWLTRPANFTKVLEGTYHRG